MATKRTRSTVRQQTPQKNDGLFDFLRLGESYTSLVLGIVVVIIAAILVLSFVRGRNVNTGSDIKEDAASEEGSETVDGISTVGDVKVYKVAQGDDLWKIAEKVYKDGYKWIDIAKENNLTDPNIIHVNNTLKLPDIKVAEGVVKMEAEVAPAVVSETEVAKVDTTAAKITAETYTVKSGDYLWDIAVRAYGDGFKWVGIAKANNITNPDIIFSGTELKLPR